MHVLLHNDHVPLHSMEAPPSADAAPRPPVKVTDPVTGAEVEMTKTAAKKLAKRAMRQEKKEAAKPERRARERQRKKEKRQELRAQRANEPEAPKVERPRAVPFHARLAIDLGFDDLMTADEATSLASQLGYLYGVNRTSPRPFEQIVFTGAGNVSGASLGFAAPHGRAHAFPTPGTSESSLFRDRVGVHMEEKNGGSWRRWQRVRLAELGGLDALAQPGVGPWTDEEACDKNNWVYLTADTDNTIEALEEGKTYIIGGVVDRNRYKHLCAKKAAALGIPTARLPIDTQHLAGQQMNARKVLTVNQVVAILVGWTETRDWTRALQRGLPTRKFAGEGATESEA